MVGCVITGHGDFATGMLSALTMIAGDQPCIQAVPFHENAAAEFPSTLQAAIHAAIKQYGSVLVCCDLVGGSPFNQTVLAVQNLPAEVVAGANLPMLLELTSMLDTAQLNDLAQTAQEAGAAGVYRVGAEMLKSSNDSASSQDTDSEEDGI